MAVQRWLDLLDLTHEALAASHCNDVAAFLKEQVRRGRRYWVTRENVHSKK